MGRTRVIVVGAGPSGILTCRHLLDGQDPRNPLQITIIGDQAASQPTTIDVDGIACDVATVYTHPGYHNTVEKLASQIGTKINYLPPAQLVDSQGTITAMAAAGVGDMIRIAIFLAHTTVARCIRHTWLSTIFHQGRMSSYLRFVGLSGLLSSYIFAPGAVAQGYGPMNEVASYRLFRWLRPSLFLISMMPTIAGRGGVGMVDGGYGTLFRRIYDALPVEKDTRLVRRVEEGRVVLVSGDILEADHIFVCCPLQRIETPLRIFPHETEFTLFASVLWTSTYNPAGLNDRMYLMDSIMEATHDRMLMVRRYGQTSSGDYIYWAVAYTTPGRSHEEVLRLLQSHATELGVSFKETKFFRVFDYNPRFTPRSIANGTHLRVRHAQGMGGIWYLGGLMSHWDIDNIYEDALEKVSWFYQYHIRPGSWTRQRFEYYRNYIQSWI